MVTPVPDGNDRLRKGKLRRGHWLHTVLYCLDHFILVEKNLNMRKNISGQDEKQIHAQLCTAISLEKILEKIIGNSVPHNVCPQVHFNNNNALTPSN